MKVRDGLCCHVRSRHGERAGRPIGTYSEVAESLPEMCMGTNSTKPQQSIEMREKQ
jgi:hypothetical protein